MKNSASRLGLVLSLIIAAGTSVGTSTPSPDPDLQKLLGYRQWQRLTDKPIAVNIGTFTG
jgi:hypothetical protein